MPRNTNLTAAEDTSAWHPRNAAAVHYRVGSHRVAAVFLGVSGPAERCAASGGVGAGKIEAVWSTSSPGWAPQLCPTPWWRGAD